jgi:hypothetical protein
MPEPSDPTVGSSRSDAPHVDPDTTPKISPQEAEALARQFGGVEPAKESHSVPLRGAKARPVFWRGDLVGFFDFFAFDDSSLMGYWFPGDGPSSAAFLEAVRQEKAPRVRLGGEPAISSLHDVVRLESGKRWRGTQSLTAQILTLSPRTPRRG